MNLMTKTPFKVANLMSLGLTILLASGTANAAIYNVDTKIGEALLDNSGDQSEINELAKILGVNPSDITLEDKVSSELTAIKDDAGSWYLDISPNEPGYYALKFGIGGLKPEPTANTFYFENEISLSRLVWTDAQVQNITGGCDANNCNIGRLSHYTTFNTAVPLPAASWLFLSAIVGLASMTRRA